VRLSRRGLETIRTRNGETVTTTETWHGFCRGEHFGGYEERARERQGKRAIVETQ